MATKAERYKAQVQRANQATKSKTKRRSRPPRAQLPGQQAREALVARKDRPSTGMPHNVAPRATKNSTYALESTAAGRPPRKSTRKSATRIKPDSSLRMRATTRATAAGKRGRR